MADVRDLVTGLRQALQDLLVPELRAIKATLEAQGKELVTLRQDMNQRFQEVNERFLALGREMNERFEALHREMDERFLRVDERFLGVEQLLASLQKDVAALNGKMDILLSHIVDFKTLHTLVGRVEALEKQVATLAQPREGPSAP